MLARGADPDAAFAFAAEPGAAFTPVTDGPALAPASGATTGTHPIPKVYTRASLHGERASVAIPILDRCG